VQESFKKIFQLATDIFFHHHQELLLASPCLRELTCAAERYIESFHRRMCASANGSAMLRRGPVNTSLPTTRYASLPFHLAHPLEVMKFLRKIHRPVRKQTMSRKCLETF
jgi:hypothetical protein